MNVHIRFEAWLLILSFLSGCWLMAVYDVLRLLRLAFPHGTFLTGAEDLLYWLYASLLTFSLLYTQNSGLVRAYVIAGVFAGMVLYNNFISRILFKLLKKLIKYFKMKRYLESLSLHTKIALISSFVLIFGGMTVIFILEFQNPLTLKSLPFSQKILASFFQSVTLRTAGFATVDMASLHQATKFFMSIIMFIGGSPAGTAGGVKTVTFVIGLLYVRALIRGDENIHVFKRTIDDQIVKRALTIMLISFAIALTGLFILSISEQADFIDLLFEVFSAFATVGLTAGITPTLTFVGKIVIIILMYIGRIGPITMVLIFVRKYNAKKGKDVNYIKEHILIG